MSAPRPRSRTSDKKKLAEKNWNRGPFDQRLMDLNGGLHIRDLSRFDLVLRNTAGFVGLGRDKCVVTALDLASATSGDQYLAIVGIEPCLNRHQGHLRREVVADLIRH